MYHPPTERAKHNGNKACPQWGTPHAFRGAWIAKFYLIAHKDVGNQKIS